MVILRFYNLISLISVERGITWPAHLFTRHCLHIYHRLLVAYRPGCSAVRGLLSVITPKPVSSPAQITGTRTTQPALVTATMITSYATMIAPTMMGTHASRRAKPSWVPRRRPDSIRRVKYQAQTEIVSTPVTFANASHIIAYRCCHSGRLTRSVLLASSARPLASSSSRRRGTAQKYSNDPAQPLA